MRSSALFTFLLLIPPLLLPGGCGQRPENTVRIPLDTGFVLLTGSSAIIRLGCAFSTFTRETVNADTTVRYTGIKLEIKR